MRLAMEAAVSSTKTIKKKKKSCRSYSQPAINLYNYEARDVQSLLNRVVSVYTTQEK